MSLPSNLRSPAPADPADQATAWFVRLRADPVDAAERQAFEAWIAQDPAHAEAYARAGALWDELGAMPDPRQRNPHGTAPARRPAPRFAPWPAALAACLLLAAVLGFWATGGYDDLRADAVTAVGETRTLALPDGSLAHLGTDTALAVDFGDDIRRVALLRGEAFFEVAKDPAHPFEVAAGSGVSRALGTAFNVRDAAGAVTVAVTEGRVRVLRPSDGAAVELGAGQAARYAPSGALETWEEDVEAATSWRRGELVFANRPLREVLAELDRYRRGTIVLLDGSIAAARFSGVLSLRDTDRALEAIAGAQAIEVVQITPYLTLLDTRD